MHFTGYIFISKKKC